MIMVFLWILLGIIACFNMSSWIYIYFCCLWDTQAIAVHLPCGEFHWGQGKNLLVFFPVYFKGKIADVMKALKSAHMSKIASSDKLQELAENILEKTKKDSEKSPEESQKKSGESECTMEVRWMHSKFSHEIYLRFLHIKSWLHVPNFEFLKVMHIQNCTHFIVYSFSWKTVLAIFFLKFGFKGPFTLANCTRFYALQFCCDNFSDSIFAQNNHMRLEKSLV